MNPDAPTPARAYSRVTSAHTNRGGRTMMWNDGGGWGWGSWLLMSLMMLAIVVLVAWGLFLLWRASGAPAAASTSPAPARTPEAILAERLARGEIDAEEYRERLDALHAGAP